MIAKVLRNPALRTKFKVGDVVRLPRSVWTRLTNKMMNIPVAEQILTEVGDRIVEHGKNRLCRFAIVTGAGTSSLMSQKVIWEEWMLERIEVVDAPQIKIETISDANPCPTAG